MFNKSVTIYNKYEVDGIEKWQRKIINKLFYDEKKGANTNRTGTEKANKVLLVIPLNLGARNGYISPKEFKKIEDKSNNWTISEGDTVVLGECTKEIIKSTKELENKYIITSVDFKNFGDMANWEVNAK